MTTIDFANVNQKIVKCFQHKCNNDILCICLVPQVHLQIKALKTHGERLETRVSQWMRVTVVQGLIVIQREPHVLGVLGSDPAFRCFKFLSGSCLGLIWMGRSYTNTPLSFSDRCRPCVGITHPCSLLQVNRSGKGKLGKGIGYQFRVEQYSMMTALLLTSSRMK